MPPVIDEELCVQCDACYEVCPQDCFTPSDGDAPPALVYPQECWHCGACVFDCPEEAVHLELPLQMHIVPSPALYGPPEGSDAQADLKRAAAFSRSVIEK